MAAARLHAIDTGRCRTRARARLFDNNNKKKKTSSAAAAVVDAQTVLFLDPDRFFLV